MERGKGRKKKKAFNHSRVDAYMRCDTQYVSHRAAVKFGASSNGERQKLAYRPEFIILNLTTSNPNDFSSALFWRFAPFRRRPRLSKKRPKIWRKEKCTKGFTFAVRKRAAALSPALSERRCRRALICGKKGN